MESMELKYKLGAWLAMAGLLLTVFGLGYVVWATFVEAHQGQAEAMREFVLSPRALLLVLLVEWAHRTLEIFRALDGKLSLRQVRFARVAALRRIRAWLSFMVAWFSTAIALMYIADWDITLTLIVCAPVFGGAMWCLEKHVTRMVIRP